MSTITTEMIYEELLKLDERSRRFNEDLKELRETSRETLRILAEGQARNDAQRARLFGDRIGASPENS
ncbi:putative CopG family antitoxin [Rhizobium aquaticum]|uniref:CopG family antitoxin n=1 Tax=Rhizobium aquaticum TaxID=1549636 RepID=A0ABV2IWX3_9HYPH